MRKTGPKNSITDIEGVLVGLYTRPRAACGVTVALFPEGAVASVDVRGSAPGTCETDLLQPINLVEKVQAIVLTGGSVYGLATAAGVVRWLAKQGRGFPLTEGQVAPIVPAAALFDLGRGEEFVPPISPEWGAWACESAGDQVVPLGSVGAGTGALSGGIKGGLGSASESLDSGLTVAALVAVNSLGSIIDPRVGRPWEIRLELDQEFGELGQRSVKSPLPMEDAADSNTTIGLVATDAFLTKTQAQKIAQMAQDGLARAIRPAHTMFDGDTIFCIATGRQPLPETPGFFAAP
ncbi:MAG: P1 family peptidase, partial [Pseudomonadota bacterium]